MVVAEVVRVELVDSWWQQALPVLALLVSLFSVALTLWFRKQEGLRIRTKVSSAVLGLPEGAVHCVVVELANLSRSTITNISGVSLALNKDNALFYVRNSYPTVSANLPARIEPGEALSVMFPKKEFLQQLRELDPPADQMRPIVTTTHKTVCGKRNRKLARALNAQANRKSQGAAES